MLREITAVKEELQRVIRISAETSNVRLNDSVRVTETTERENEEVGSRINIPMVELHGDTESDEENVGENNILAETPNY